MEGTVTDYLRGWRDGVEAAASGVVRWHRGEVAQLLARWIRALTPPEQVMRGVNNSAAALNCEGQQQTNDKLCPECGGDGNCRKLHQTERLRTLSCDGPCETCGGSGRVP